MDMLKLKHPTLCQLVLYVPALLFFVVIILGIPIVELFEDAAWLWLILFIISAGFSLYYLLRYMTLFIASDIPFAMIRFWKRDRLWYPIAAFFENRSDAEEKLSARAKGRVLAPVKQIPQPILLRRQKQTSWTVNYGGIEKITMIYSISELDHEALERIMASARANLRNIHFKETDFFLVDARQKKQPVATATAVVILADSVSDAVTERIRQSVSRARGYMLPCVVDFSTGTCWYDAMARLI